MKSGVYRETVIDNDWLVKTRTVRSKSLLQHFHRTWVDVTAKGEPFILRLVSNKNFDHNDPILGLIDNLTDRIPRWKLDGLGPNSAGGKHLAAWAEHLEVPIDDLKDFLTEVIFVHRESESSWADRAAALMRNAGFRGDDDAVVRGVEMVRGWVKNCAGLADPRRHSGRDGYQGSARARRRARPRHPRGRPGCPAAPPERRDRHRRAVPWR